MSRIDDALFAEHGWSVHEVDGSRRVLACQGCSTLLAFGREYVSTKESKVVVTGEGDVLGRSREFGMGERTHVGDGCSVVEIFSPGKGGNKVTGTQVGFSGGFSGGIGF